MYITCGRCFTVLPHRRTALLPVQSGALVWKKEPASGNWNREVGRRAHWKQWRGNKEAGFDWRPMWHRTDTTTAQPCNHKCRDSAILLTTGSLSCGGSGSLCACGFTGLRQIRSPAAMGELRRRLIVCPKATWCSSGSLPLRSLATLSSWPLFPHPLCLLQRSAFLCFVAASLCASCCHKRTLPSCPPRCPPRPHC